MKGRGAFNFMFRFSKAKEIGGLTNFLSTNYYFKKFALNFHTIKTGGMKDLTDYLDKELLEKEPQKRLDSKSGGKDKQKWTDFDDLAFIDKFILIKNN